MHSSRQTTASISTPEFPAFMPPPPIGTHCAPQTRQAEDRAYQAVTVAAMLMLLGSLWAF
jgi:hypothetical protein